jgi:hypothetical protein
MNKQKFLDIAETIDSLRLVPRIILFGWGYFTALLCYQTLHWYYSEPATARGLEESGMVTGVVGLLTGFWYKIYQEYGSRGRDWDANATSSTTLTQTTTVPTVQAKDP